MKYARKWYVYRMNLRWSKRWLFADTVTAGYASEASYDENRTLRERNWTACPKDLHSFL